MLTPALRGRKVKKNKKNYIFRKIDQFDHPPRGGKVKKSKKTTYLVKSIIFTSHQQVEKSESRKNPNIL